MLNSLVSIGATIWIPFQTLSLVLRCAFNMLLLYTNYRKKAIFYNVLNLNKKNVNETYETDLIV